MPVSCFDEHHTLVCTKVQGELTIADDCVCPRQRILESCAVSESCCRHDNGLGRAAVQGDDGSIMTASTAVRANT